MDRQRPSIDPSLETALQHKRTALDREVDAFRAAKDAEYREYEVQVRSRHDDRRLSNGTASASSAVIANHSSATTPTKNPTSTAGTEAPTNGVPRTERGSSGSNADERELRALFAPYVALMDEPRAPLASKPAPKTSRTPATGAPPITRVGPAAAAAASVASSNPTIVKATAPGPPARRASSSPIPGIALRSSLRQPTTHPPRGGRSSDGGSSVASGSSAGRGTKHVLFAIDDVVLSPSSSPLARRDGGGATAPRPPTPAKSTDGGLGARLAGTPPRGKAHLLGKDRSGRGAESDSGSPSARSVDVPRPEEDEDEDEEAAIVIPRVSPARIPRPPSLLASPPRRSYRDLVEPTNMGKAGSRSLNAEEPERMNDIGIGSPDIDEFPAGLGDQDPLFAFDDGEGIDGGQWEDDEGSPERSPERSRRGVVGAEVEAKETGSPMAGSLPIEIKWSGKRT